MDNDKKIEYMRYDVRARSQLTSCTQSKKILETGSLSIPLIYRAPYIWYERCICRCIRPGHDVLELAAGTGLHTYIIAQRGARVTASDISSNSLKVISQQIENIYTTAADMESLPFENNSFDIVTVAGSLSYGDPDLVDAEIKRVLRPDGAFLCVDSLNHNPVYKFNRWLQYLRGSRTKSTLLRMPTIRRIESIIKGFKSADIKYFGAVSYLTPFLANIIGQSNSAKISDAVDHVLHVRRSAFKFVLVARGLL